MMTADEYQRWKDDPLTVKFHQYLTDYRQDLMERWARGAIQSPDDLMAVARCQCCLEIVELDDDSISEFYRKTTKGSDDDNEGKEARSV